MLIKNRKFLSVNNLGLLNKLDSYKRDTEENTTCLEESKSGQLTIRQEFNGKTQYLHSKYDPVKEAERLVDQIVDLNAYKHIILVGIGLGYHLQEILKRYPDMRVTIYENNLEVLRLFLEHYDLSELSAQTLQMIISSDKESEIKEGLHSIHNVNGRETLVYSLPSVSKQYNEQELLILETLKEQLKDKHNNLAVKASFQQKWTVNAIQNFPKLLQTPNILHDCEKSYFKNKPAIIVAAGPSLNEELENLRSIKEKGLAYIFSVGSAINALIEFGIIPDAACTYDPTEKNQYVFQKVKEKGIDIPLLFGSTVDHETLSNYPGELLHMITSQDTVAAGLLDTSQNIDIVFDAPSIAVVAFQLLTKLECNPIVLVGQNLGYRNNERYAAGIEYSFIDNNISVEEQKELKLVKDVHGNTIYTTDTFNIMRKQFELYIKSSPNITVYNTTTGGAHIEGTMYCTLTELLEKEFLTSVVNSNAFQQKNSYSLEYVTSQLKTLVTSKKRLFKSIEKTNKELEKIRQSIRQNRRNKLEVLFAEFDQEFKKMKNNSFYQVFIEPMVRVQNERLSEDSQFIRFEKDVIKKGQIVLDLFGDFISHCEQHIEFITPYFEELCTQIEDMVK